MSYGDQILACVLIGLIVGALMSVVIFALCVAA